MIKLPWIAKWLTMTQDQVLNKFQGIPGSFTDGRGQERFVYIPPTRKDKVLLVAHADTVWNFAESGDDSRIRLKYENHILSTNNKDFGYEVHYQNGKKRSSKGIGIGADDRAGCGLVWALRNLGHGILITSGEEIGCIATHRIMKNDWWKKEIASYNFAVQFDRRGNNDIVFYDVGTKSFAKYVQEQTKYVPAEGTTTDIRHLCEDICGVNISVGYYDEHTIKETLNIKEFEHTLETVSKWLSQSDIPKFAFNYSDKFKIKTRHVSMADDYAWSSVCIPEYDQASSTKSNKNLDFFQNSKDVTVVCPYCKTRMLQEAWLKARFICSQCGQG